MILSAQSSTVSSCITSIPRCGVGRLIAHADYNSKPFEDQSAFPFLKIPISKFPASHVYFELVCGKSQRNKIHRFIATQWCDQAAFSECSPRELQHNT